MTWLYMFLAFNVYLTFSVFWLTVVLPRKSIKDRWYDYVFAGPVLLILWVSAMCVLFYDKKIK